jgi:prepilin-type N-terminal cleavage/methylation domain-containing protein
MQNRRTQNAERITTGGAPARGALSQSSSSLIVHRSSLCADRKAFTLTEILVVIVIIVIVLGMAVPVFKFITGSRSEEGATNQIAAMLGRARSDAIGLQKPMGVAFFTGGDGRAYMAEVEMAQCPTFSSHQVFQKGDYAKVANPNSILSTSPPYYYYIYTNPTQSNNLTTPPSNTTQSDLPGTWQWVGGPPIDIRADTDIEALPTGTAVQTLCDYQTTNTGGNPGARQSDNYLGVGVILFDSDGAVTTTPYGISIAGKLSFAANFSAIPDNGTNSPRLHGFPDATGVLSDWDPSTGQPQPHSSLGVKSQVGLVVFNREAFVTQGFSATDPVYDYPTGSAPYTNEAAEEQWLDNNAQPLLIDRFNGSLVRQD